ncbi:MULTISPECIES: DUF2256 domain-containing protein [Desulfosediminicola]|uniref:DUF2256 domain-containing protein n=1 Tax=Desulfosediminicola TaxID=2886823 RepID=UPI0010ACF41F
MIVTMARKPLETKICPVCNRPFSWRKKWRRNWPEIVYCSERCRRSGFKRKNGDENT